MSGTSAQRSQVGGLGQGFQGVAGKAHIVFSLGSILSGDYSIWRVLSSESTVFGEYSLWRVYSKIVLFGEFKRAWSVESDI